jgi:hypothetical protein
VAYTSGVVEMTGLCHRPSFLLGEMMSYRLKV